MMTPEQIADIEVWRKAFAIRLDTLEKNLEANKDVTARIEANTAEMVEMFRNWKGAMKVLDFLGAIAKPLAAIGAVLSAWFAWRHGK